MSGPKFVVSPSWFIVAILFATCSGCASYAQRLSLVHDAYHGNRLEYAEKAVIEAADKDRAHADVLRLDQAIIQLAAGKPRDAEKTLRQVRDTFDEREVAVANGKTLSYLTDDNSRIYLGEDYEKVLIRAFLALSNLMHDGGDAEAYSLQMIDKQERIIAEGVEKNGENPKKNYQRVAVAPYLRGVMREATHLNYDDAERSYISVVNWQPAFLAGKFDLDRAVHGRHSHPGNGVLYVFAMTGRGPCKQEVVEAPTSASLLIAGEIVSALGSQTVPPNVAPVKVPKVVPQINAIQAIELGVNGRPVGATETVTDVTQLVVQQSEAVYPHVVARAVARRCVKMGVVYGSKEMTGISKGSLPSLAVDLVGIAWEATEHADTRGWGLLPDKIQVLRLELPAGEHDISLCPIVSHRPLPASATTQRVRIADSRNTYVMANFPQTQLVGRVLVSQP